jgi:uncharacterized phage protein (TIGR02220 family)
MYWLCDYVDDIFEPDFLEKQLELLKKIKEFKQSEIKEAYELGVQLLKQDFKIIEQKGKKKKINKAVSKETKVQAQRVIDYLNDKVGSSFTIQGNNLDLIKGRLDEGFVYADFITVIDKKYEDWKGSDYEKFLRPLTLFAKSKFENYLNANYDTRPTTKFYKFTDSISKAQQLIKLRKDE